MPEMMNAIIFEDIGKLVYKKVPVPEIKNPDDVLIKVEAGSICGTDLHIISGSYPSNKNVILGHEGTGVVVAVGSSVTAYKPGDRVVIDCNIPCGDCVQCKMGNLTLCENIYTIGIETDGIFAEYAVITARALIKVPEDMPVEDAIFAEPMADVVNCIKRLQPMAGETGLVLGAGPFGAYFVQLLQKTGCKVLVSEVAENRIEFAKNLGADQVINPMKQDLVAEVKAATNGLGVDFVIDAVGSQLDKAISCVRGGGRISCYGMNSNAYPAVSQYDIVRKNLTIYGSFACANAFIEGLNWMHSGVMNMKPYITHQLALKDYEIGFEATRNGEAMEVILYPEWDHNPPEAK